MKILKIKIEVSIISGIVANTKCCDIIWILHGPIII